MRIDRTLRGASPVTAWLAGPADEPPIPAGPARPLAQAADSNNEIITEVLFVLVSGETTFVELTNVGRVAVDLSSFVLR